MVQVDVAKRSSHNTILKSILLQILPSCLMCRWCFQRGVSVNKNKLTGDTDSCVDLIWKRRYTQSMGLFTDGRFHFRRVNITSAGTAFKKNGDHSMVSAFINFFRQSVVGIPLYSRHSPFQAKEQKKEIKVKVCICSARTS